MAIDVVRRFIGDGVGSVCLYWSLVDTGRRGRKVDLGKVGLRNGKVYSTSVAIGAGLWLFHS